MIDLIVRAGTIITVDPERRVLIDGAIAINEGSIVAIGHGSDIEATYEATRTIDAPDAVALPGLVDAHSHAGHSLVRTMGDDLDGWMEACRLLYLHGATPGFWYAEGRLSAAERLLCGTTTSLSMLGGAGDTVRSDNPDHGREHLRAYDEAGLRTVLVVGPGAPPFPKATTDHTTPGTPRPVESSFADQLDTVVALVDHAAGLDRGHVATTFPTLTQDELGAPGLIEAAEELSALAARHDLLIVQDGHRADTVRASEALGLLGPRTLLSHAIDLDTVEIGLIAASAATVAHNPSAIYSQFGRCPVPELLDAGVTVGLGSDATAPDRSADMFRHMFQLTRYHRAMRRDPGLFPPHSTIEMATLGSARALGLNDHVGSLEVGKAADIVLVDTAQPHLTPFTHPEHQLVYFATGADVVTVIVDGEVLLDNRDPVGIDIDEILNDARDEQRAALARVGLDHLPNDRGH
ncbi:MAG: amidohydrolase family protein [Acidimicrobiia bacterium]